MSDVLEAFPRDAIWVKDPYNKEALEAMHDSTPARICVGRVGPRPPVEPWLSFRWDEALAKDAVFGVIPDDFLQKVGINVRVQSSCEAKRDYLAHPEKGGVLLPEAEQVLVENCKMSPKAQVFVSEGLSSLSILENLPTLLPAILDGFKSAGIETGTTFFVDLGRVRMLNDVGRVLKPEIAVMLIGERPGLVTQTSLSAYIAYKPQPGHTDAERNCISNIYSKGLNPLEAAAQIVDIAKRMLEQKTSGVGLKL